MTKIDLLGKTFGRLTVTAPLPSRKTKGGTTRALWECRCKCGNIVSVQSVHLVGNHTVSCGCFSKDVARINRLGEAKHGHSRLGKVSPTYRSWRAMVGRCTNSNHKDWPKYGAKGIEVSESWLDFEQFLTDMGERPKGTSLDRIDNRFGYHKANCRWATPAQQSQNQTTTKLSVTAVLSIRRDDRTNAMISKDYGVSASHVSNVKRGKVWKNV